jgi:hypothetical protein
MGKSKEKKLFSGASFYIELRNSSEQARLKEVIEEQGGRVIEH